MYENPAIKIYIIYKIIAWKYNCFKIAYKNFEYPLFLKPIYYLKFISSYEYR